MVLLSLCHGDLLFDFKRKKTHLVVLGCRVDPQRSNLPWSWSSYTTARALTLGKAFKQRASVPAALLELPGTDINETVKRETDR